MQRALFGIAIAALVTTTGCTSYRGADRLQWGVGPNFEMVSATDRKTRNALGAARAFHIRQIFLGDLQAAYVARSGTGDTRRVNTRLANSGLALVRVNCNEYFNEMGRNQRNAMVLRDLVSPITSAIETAINLHLFGKVEADNQNFLLGFGALTSAGTSALDIYDRRFLFSSDNIDAVRANTFKALATNADATIKDVPDDFVHVITRLQEMENICTPAAILANVRSSLKTTDFKNDSTDEGDQPPPAGDEKAASDAAQVTTTSQ